MKHGKKRAAATPHRDSQSSGIASTAVFSDFPHVATTDTNNLKTTWITAKVASHLESDTFLIVIALFTVIWLIMELVAFCSWSHCGSSGWPSIRDPPASVCRMQDNSDIPLYIARRSFYSLLGMEQGFTQVRQVLYH